MWHDMCISKTCILLSLLCITFVTFPPFESLESSQKEMKKEHQLLLCLHLKKEILFSQAKSLTFLLLRPTFSTFFFNLIAQKVLKKQEKRISQKKINRPISNEKT